MDPELILRTLIKIETTVIKNPVLIELEFDNSISDELKKIQLSTKDPLAFELICSISFNWNLFSGNKAVKGFKPHTEIVKQWILEDCEKLRLHCQQCFL